MAAVDLAIPVERVFRSERHSSFYLEAGPADGSPIIFLHGWPELAISWRHQLSCFGSLGFRAIAPDMRGYGRSTVHPKHEDYSVEQIARDMIELLDSLGAADAIWVGHDWGSPIAWTIASHYPERCAAVISLCVPYIPAGWARPNLVPLVDRSVYPASEFPSGQWEYWDHYVSDFAFASADFERDTGATVAALFRRGNPEGINQPEVTGRVRREGGWGTFIDMLRDYPIDDALLGRQDYSQYVAALQRNGFFGPDSWYMNDDRNIAYAARAQDGGRISRPALFIAGEYDYTCKIKGTRLGDPMRAACLDLTEDSIASGHWMTQEKPVEVNAKIARWLVETVPDRWPAGKVQR